MQIDVLNKKTYKNYEEYTIQVKNLTDKDILLDSMENTKSVYLTGKEDIKYYSQLYEKTKEELLIKKNLSTTITIRFTKEYSSNSNSYRMLFNDIIKNYDEYKSLKTNYSGREKLGIVL